MTSNQRKQRLEKQINEKKVLVNELKQMKKGSSVYRQQQNSNIFFKEDPTKVFSDSKRSLDDLVDEYKQCDKMSEETLQQEGPSDTDSLKF